MNERIKELLEQAGVKYVTMPKDTVYEKLAKLVVQECMDVVAKKCASPTAYNALAEHWKVDE